MFENIDVQSLDEVTSPYFFKAKKIDQNGLLSERIFGTTRKNRCSCGNLHSKVLHDGQLCDKCGVMCTDNDVRYEKYGKVCLPYFVINPLKHGHFTKIIPKTFHYVINPILSDMARSSTAYIKYDPFEDEIEFVDEFDYHSCIPLNITGIQTLYIALSSLVKINNSKLAKTLVSYFIKDLLVIPPKARLSVFDHGVGNKRKFIESDIDRAYNNVIFLSNVNSSKIDSEDVANLVEVIITTWTEKSEIAISDDELMLDDESTAKIQFSVNAVYTEILNKLSGKEGAIRSSFLGLLIDYTGRAVISPNLSLNTYEINMPKAMLIKLYSLEFLRFMREVKHEEFKELTLSMKRINHTDINIDHLDEFIEYFFKNTSIRQRLVLINRQPSLWRFSCSGVVIKGISEGNTLEVSPLILGPIAGDYDGDALPIYRLHDSESLKEIETFSFIANDSKMDHNDQYLHELSKETIYSFNILKSNTIDTTLDTFIVDKLSNLTIDYKLLENYETPVLIQDLDITVPYGQAILNNWCGFDDIKLTEKSTGWDVSNEIFNNSSKCMRYHDTLSELNRLLHWFMFTHPTESLTLPFGDAVDVIENTSNMENNLLEKLPKSPYIGYVMYIALVKRIQESIPKSSQLYKLTKAKFNATQFARSLVGIGYIADNNNLIDPEPISSGLLEGIDYDTFFKTSFGTRKGLIDKEKGVPQSGALERAMALNVSPIELIEDDCGDEGGLQINVVSKKHAWSLIGRYVKGNTDDWMLVTNENHDFLINHTIDLRSPITCKTEHNKICRKCFGETKIATPYLGIIAAQVVAERLTQLSMSSFHTSGSANLKISKFVNDFFFEYLKEITNTTNYCDIEFTNVIPIEVIDEIKTYEGFDTLLGSHKIRFNNLNYKIENEDVAKTIAEIKSILKSETNKLERSLLDNYTLFITSLLSLSDIKSVFVECILSNMYLVNDEIYRYALIHNPHAAPTRKLGVQQIAAFVSPILAMLFQPNIKNYLATKDEEILESNHKDIGNLSVFVKIWNGVL